MSAVRSPVRHAVQVALCVLLAVGCFGIALAPAFAPAAEAASSAPANNRALFRPKNQTMPLLQPVGTMTEVEGNLGFNTAFKYFNDAWPWLLGTAAGIAVLHALIGGIAMMMSGGDSGKREEGKNRLMWALAGLLMIGFSGFILRTINPLFFTGLPTVSPLADILGIETAHAASKIPSVTNCSPLQPGCGGGTPSTLIGTSASVFDLSALITLLLKIAAGLSVAAIVWAGMRMLISFGDDSKIAQGKWGIMWSLIGLSIAIISQQVVSFVATQSYTQGGGDLPLQIIAASVTILRNILNPLFLVLAVVAGIRMVYAQGKSDEFNKGRTMITWMIVGAIVINLAHALVKVVADYFGL